MAGADDPEFLENAEPDSEYFGEMLAYFVGSSPRRPRWTRRSSRAGSW